MSQQNVEVSCPRCTSSLEMEAMQLVLGPVTRTCPSCGLVFRIGAALNQKHPEDPVYETDAGWYARKADGAVLYFPNLSVLVKWASDGMVALTDEISKKGREWRPISDLPEFTALALRAESQPVVPPLDDSTATVQSPLLMAGDSELGLQEPPRRRAAWVWIVIAAFILGSLLTWLITGLMRPDSHLYLHTDSTPPRAQTHGARSPAGGPAGEGSTGRASGTSPSGAASVGASGRADAANADTAAAAARAVGGEAGDRSGSTDEPAGGVAAGTAGTHAAGTAATGAGSPTGASGGDQVKPGAPGGAPAGDDHASPATAGVGDSPASTYDDPAQPPAPDEKAQEKAKKEATSREEEAAKEEAPKPQAKPRPRSRSKPRSSPNMSYDRLMDLGAEQLRTDPKKAVTTFMRALQSPSATSEARAKLGRAYLRMGDHKAAISQLERARRSNPHYRPAMWDLAQAYRRTGSKEKARAVYQDLLERLNPSSKDAARARQAMESL
jgi:hypothetical protein